MKVPLRVSETPDKQRRRFSLCRWRLPRTQNNGLGFQQLSVNYTQHTHPFWLSPIVFPRLKTALWLYPETRPGDALTMPPEDFDHTSVVKRDFPPLINTTTDRYITTAEPKHAISSPTTPSSQDPDLEKAPLLEIRCVPARHSIDSESLQKLDQPRCLAPGLFGPRTMKSPASLPNTSPTICLTLKRSKSI